MLKPSFLLPFLFLTFISHILTSSEQASKPDQIIQLFRHGARGPLSNYDPSWPLSEWGMLTPAGMRQQYILGNVLGQKYPDIFGDSYEYLDIYMLSDVTPRCIQSAVTQLYGVYLEKGPALRKDYPRLVGIPPYKDLRVKVIAGLLPNSAAAPYNFVPNIVNVVDQTNAYIFQGDQGNYCPNMITWEEQNNKDSKAQEAWKIFGTTIDNLNKHLNDSQKISSVPEFINFCDTMLCDLYDNRTLPGGIADQELISNLTFAFNWFIYHAWEGQELQRQLAAFTLVDEFLSQMDDCARGGVFNKAALYSGHDDNIMAVLAAFGIINEDCIMQNFNSYLQNKTTPFPNCYFPYFASNIIFELHNTSGSPFVKFFYNNVQIPLCNGQDICPYDDFVAFVKKATGNNTFKTYSQKCGVKTETLVSEVSNFLNYFELGLEMNYIALVIVSLLCGLISMKIISDRKKYDQLLNRNEATETLYSSMKDTEVN